MQKIGLFIDGFNFEYSKIESIISELEYYGNIHFIYFYSTQLSHLETENIDYRYSIESHTYENIVVDLVKELSSLNIDSFAIASNNSNYDVIFNKFSSIKSYFLSDFEYLFSESANINFNLQNLIETQVFRQLSKEQVIQHLSQDVIKNFLTLNPENNLISLSSYQVYLDSHINYKEISGYHNIHLLIDSLNIFKIIKKEHNFYLKLKQKFVNIKKHSREDILSDDNLRYILLDSYEKLQNKQEKVCLNTYFNFLSMNHKFNHVNYGYQSFNDFINVLDLFKIEEANNKISISLL